METLFWLDGQLMWSENAHGAGWYVRDQPTGITKAELKSDPVDDPNSDGDFDRSDSDLHYAAKEITFARLGYVGQSASDVLAARRWLNGLTRRANVELRWQNADGTFYLLGAVETTPAYELTSLAFEVQVVVSTTKAVYWSYYQQELNLTSQASSSGSVGVSYGDGLTYGAGFTYGSSGLLETNSGTLRNAGNSPAWPTFEIHGNYPSGVRVTSSAGDVLEWAAPIYASAPVTLDCFNRRGLIMGVDQSTNLSRRDFFSVPPGGQLGVTFMPLEASSGYCVARVRDTYI